jgi:DNA-binding SARP family transcriptional activator
MVRVTDRQSTTRERSGSTGIPGDRTEAVRIKLLGGFSISVGARTIAENEWRLKKAAALVKLLALAPNHRLHREQAMEVLWPTSGTRAASNSLRQVLYGARKILDPAADSDVRYLSIKEEHLDLCPEGQLWVDVDAFEEASTTARRARDPAVYRVAIDLYTGDLLPDDRYEEWVENRRENLGQLYLALLIELAGLYEERDEHGLAIEALRKATAKEPTLEDAHIGLMRLHALSGRPEQALAQYERLRDALLRSLGTEPGVTTRRLRDEIAAGRFAPTPPTDSPQEREPSGAGKHNMPAPTGSLLK